MSTVSFAYPLVTSLLCAVAACNVVYLLVLLIAARAAKTLRTTRPGTENGPLPHLWVVIPAHNEELVLAATLNSLDGQNYPRNLFSVVVVADNCTDSTAFIARQYGASVLERTNLDERGKGYALDFAFSQLLADPSTSDLSAVEADGFVILDADTGAAPDFLSTMAARLRQECEQGTGYRTNLVALQGRYGVLNQSEGWRASLMAGAFDLFNHVKPLGQDYFGLSMGLKGNGMAFTRPVLEQARWRGHSVTEDIDYGLDLLQYHGVRVGYVPDARVRAQMPTTAGQAASQRARWEGGRYRLMRERALPLLGAGLRRRDVRLLDASFNLLSLPLSEIATLLSLLTLLVGGGIYLSLLSLQWLAVTSALWIGFTAYIIGGLYIADAPREVYVSLLRAPFYAVWKLALYIPALLRRPRSSGAVGKTGAEWVRTERAAITVETPPIPSRAAASDSADAFKAVAKP